MVQRDGERQGDDVNWQPIETVPKDGRIVMLKCESHPEYGEHAMYWADGNWIGRVFSAMGAVKICWDEDALQPTHWCEVAKCKAQCECDLRNRAWNPAKGRCESCGLVFVDKRGRVTT